MKLIIIKKIIYRSNKLFKDIFCFQKRKWEIGVYEKDDIKYKYGRK